MSCGHLALESLVDYELRCSKRYRRSVSLVMVLAVNVSVDLKTLLQPTKRESDEFFVEVPLRIC